MEDASHASKSDHPRVQSNQFKGQDSGSTVGASQYATQNLEKVNELQSLLGQNARPIPPELGLKPPGLTLLSFFYYLIAIIY